MTNEQAIAHFKEQLEIFGGEHHEAMKVAIEALEKQIPQKVKYKNRHGEGFDLYNRDYYNCPRCGRRLRNKQKDNRCGRCGQAIDWSE